MVSNTFVVEYIESIFNTLRNCCRPAAGLQLFSLSYHFTPPADDLSSVRYIVCYGLGSPSSNRNSRAQTGLLLHLQQLCPAASVLLYDPVFCTDDENLFASYGFKVERLNEECARRTSGRRTLFYMPHCSWEMYNNLLWANWSAEELSNVIVIGNDVRDLNSFLPDSRFRSKYSYLHAALRQGLAELWRIPALTAHNTEFVCSAVMWFPRARLQQQVEALWADCERPEYGEDCVELVKATKTSTTDDSEQERLQSLKL